MSSRRQSARELCTISTLDPGDLEMFGATVLTYARHIDKLVFGTPCSSADDCGCGSECVSGKCSLPDRPNCSDEISAGQEWDRADKTTIARAVEARKAIRRATRDSQGTRERAPLGPRAHMRIPKDAPTRARQADLNLMSLHSRSPGTVTVSRSAGVLRREVFDSVGVCGTSCPP